ncbi:kinetoplastid-specific phospho-protein phosphatase, putative [Trypanosoma equiperdum]|uniref:Serine/threonine-protein phosphatase n=2 Tax=Trypanozoon TaxID=39700 RepID=Q38AV2_TRYB2|nr:serine/threonine protein phosphatase, putative [Trypanosoma brucei brucei TREU927]EAN78068.1 serine/threonine protein phosphatase, putative [Trypanosoma brucei brucei TREU927]SCU70414.1 kinetoplastid-specific phospho-protein phosphatase, putative [Trypanosoma equiperdum]
MGFFSFKSNEKLKSGADGRNATGSGSIKPSGPTDGDGGFSGSSGRPVALTAEEHHEGVDPLGYMSHLPVTDIIELYTSFRNSLQECPDLVQKRYFVSTVKTLSSQMKLRDFSEKSISTHDGTKLPIVKRVLREVPSVRSRLALALQNFCHVTDWELENEEIECGTGLLATLRGESSRLRSGHEVDEGESAARLIPRMDSFDPTHIYNLVSTTDKLPSMQEMAELIRRTNELLLQEVNVVLVSAPCVVVGDIHGQKKDLIDNVLAAGGPIAPCGTDAVPEGKPDDGAAKPAGRNYLFLGDIVDRGPESLGCLALLFAAKLMAPKSVHLLRGNHESSETNRNYGFLRECWERYPINSPGGGGPTACTGGNTAMDCVWELQSHPLWVLANETFRSLPLCAVVTGEAASPSALPNCGKHREGDRQGGLTLCAMHGGLSPFIAESLDGILAVNRFRDIVDGPLADLTWADPVSALALFSPGNVAAAATTAGNVGSELSDTNNGAPPQQQEGRFQHHRMAVQRSEPVPTTSATVGHVLSSRGRGHNFGEDVTLRFLRKNKMDFIVRAHQCVMEGYEWQHQRRLLTLFSAPNYCGCGNKGAILIVHERGDPELVQFEAAGIQICGAIAAVSPKPSPVPPKEFCS